jgi:hypothetical protein
MSGNIWSEDIAQSYLNAAEEPGALLFTPPAGWKIADPSKLPSRVKVMVIGQGKYDFPPSINLGMEPWKGTVKDYLKLVVKPANQGPHFDWKDLGIIKTQAGEASLSQVDIVSPWGDQRLMHVILKKDDQLYVLTAAALKEEFPEFYKDFFASMRSLRFNKDYLEMIPSAKRRGELQVAIKRLKDGAELVKIINSNIFASNVFQNEYWGPFKDILLRNFADMSPAWHNHVLKRLELEINSFEAKEKAKA